MRKSLPQPPPISHEISSQSHLVLCNPSLPGFCSFLLLFYAKQDSLTCHAPYLSVQIFPFHFTKKLPSFADGKQEITIKHMLSTGTIQIVLIVQTVEDEYSLV